MQILTQMQIKANTRAREYFSQIYTVDFVNKIIAQYFMNNISDS